MPRKPRIRLEFRSRRSISATTRAVLIDARDGALRTRPATLSD
jgi:hypothetical protein